MLSSSRTTEGRAVPHRKSSASLHLVLNSWSTNTASRSKRTLVFHCGLAPQPYRIMCVRARANTSMAARSSFRFAHSAFFLHNSSFAPLRRFPWDQFIVLWIEVACPAPELKSKPRPQRCVVAVGIEVPACTPRGPDGAPHPLLHLLIERLLDLGPHLNGRQLAPVHQAQTVEDVIDLRLDHEDHRIVTQAGVWADEQEQIGKPRNGCPQISTGVWMPALIE